jgi:hypothetical protein
LLLLSAAFFVPLPHKDALGQSCCPPSRFPGLGRWQNTPALPPRYHPRTTARNACRRCSTSRIRQVADATVRHYD